MDEYSENIILTIVKGTVGIIGNSQAMIADAIESCADIISSFVVLVGLNFLPKAPDKNHPYGHGKFEPIATFITYRFFGFFCFYYRSTEYYQNFRWTYRRPF